MITGIILAVLALLAIVFLIAFNIRASSPRKADVPDSPSLRESVHGAEVDARRQESMRETPGRDIRAQQKSAADVPHTKKAAAAERHTEPKSGTRKSMDEEYRQALREMFYNEKKPGDENASSDTYMDDNEYRAAMRAISKKKQE
ncbi:hypothetical protein [Aneurinibacillus aneurinilyticus]|uniref:Uncharacterized protein n=1 Tax=Aneurinibacillus aneurinilyticus ATCC 12856 TaxID=649747 RepID=U1X270_ANEAE|nr:hypothetical protein [Aneurinibacillus aneurinilyticus]ERI09065.1 hypothetical protein HMPREF0083_02843 [Aneurinibacillus aneurinilyticus ATCC 12856]MED0707529.1 hypothetical protein [Aneurinibacillus aneurinilyticus]MED0723897.1 hypothetical protein [Aneurinibacillus aneurinilyticus]MED0731769.1 hypothetical protein [Aneurinibacillus aneurinilyticus]MED0739431.1 hypothetical protein [Aneurinibacillus aneurinilyticus]